MRENLFTGRVGKPWKKAAKGIGVPIPGDVQEYVDVAFGDRV